MTLHLLAFLFGILLPYGLEQYLYSRWISANTGLDPRPAKTVLQGYRLRFIWDASYIFLLLNATYQIVFLQIPFLVFAWLGYACFLLGIFLRIWALKEVAQFYDPGIAVQVDHQLITTGPYRVIRHPLHMGTVLQISGLAALAPFWLALPIIVVSLWLCLSINRTEDRLHAQWLESSFDVYYQNTWDLVDLIFWKRRRK